MQQMYYHWATLVYTSKRLLAIHQFCSIREECAPLHRHGDVGTRRVDSLDVWERPSAQSL